ncbi:hypothetical protein ACH5RR_032414 [Cinchona calisaya]|uniref:Integrase zinc-binding domain-containing protein n=1 Tax=Cinchona calisaya TaxID=153742 RepID=A0ABD2YME9_9GENT
MDVELKAVSMVSTDPLQRIQQTWEVDTKLKSIIQDKMQDPSQHPHYSWSQGKLTRKGKLVVGDNAELRIELIKLYHSSAAGGHSGTHATYHRIASLLYWKGLHSQDGIDTRGFYWPKSAEGFTGQVSKCIGWKDCIFKDQRDGDERVGKRERERLRKLEQKRRDEED